MGISTFLGYLAAWSTITSLIVEAMKIKLGINAKNIAAFVTAIVVGLVGNLTICYFNATPINSDVIATSILMGLACGITSQVGYDKVKQAIEQIGGVK